MRGAGPCAGRRGGPRRTARRYVDFANVVSIFWGTVMTPTLVAVYAPHAVALRFHAPVPLGGLMPRRRWRSC